MNPKKTSLKSVFSRIRQTLTFEFGFTLSEIDIDLSEYQGRFGVSDQSEKDFYWSLLNKAILKVYEFSNTHHDVCNNQRIIYFLMVLFLYYEGRKNDSLLTMKNCLEMDFQRWELSPYEVDVHFIGPSDCFYCESLKEKYFAPEDGFENWGLDIMKCSRKGNCSIRLFFKGRRNLNDRLIMKK